MFDTAKYSKSGRKLTVAKFRLINEVNRLFSLYKPYVGDECQPMAGGAQGLLMRLSNNSSLGQAVNRPSCIPSQCLTFSFTVDNSETFLRSDCSINDLPVSIFQEYTYSFLYTA